MRSKVGSTILACLMYSQVAFGLAAVGAVIKKDRASDQAVAGHAVEVASVSGAVVR
jgi:hypothetical protein